MRVLHSKRYQPFDLLPQNCEVLKKRDRIHERACVYDSLLLGDIQSFLLLPSHRQLVWTLHRFISQCNHDGSCALLEFSSYRLLNQQNLVIRWVIRLNQVLFDAESLHLFFHIHSPSLFHVHSFYSSPLVYHWDESDERLNQDLWFVWKVRFHRFHMFGYLLMLWLYLHQVSIFCLFSFSKTVSWEPYEIEQ